MLVDTIQKWPRDEQNGVFYQFHNKSGYLSAKYSFRQLHEASQQVISLIQKQGIVRGQRVLLVYDQGFDYIVALISCLQLGVTTIPVHAPEVFEQSAIAPFAAIQRDAGTSVALTSSEVYRRITLAKSNGNTEGTKCLTSTNWITTRFKKDGGSTPLDSVTLPSSNAEAVVLVLYNQTFPAGGEIVTYRQLIQSVQDFGKTIFDSNSPIDFSGGISTPQTDYLAITAILWFLEQGNTVFVAEDTAVPSLWLELATKYELDMLVSSQSKLKELVDKIGESGLQLVHSINLSSVKSLLLENTSRAMKTVEEFEIKYRSHHLSLGSIVCGDTNSFRIARDSPKPLNDDKVKVHITDDEVMEVLKKLVAVELNLSPDEIPLDTPLMELGLDSMALVGIQGEIGEEFGIELDDEMSWDYDTDLRTVEQMVRELLDAVHPTVTDDEIMKTLKQLVAAEIDLEPDDIPENTPLLELGLDSMALLGIQGEVSEKFDVEFDDDEAAWDYDLDLRSVLEMITERLNTSKTQEFDGESDDLSYPLTRAQQRMLVLESLQPGMYNMPAKLKLSKSTTLESVQNSLRKLLERHTVLCTRYDQNLVTHQVVGKVELSWAREFKVHSLKRALSLEEEQNLFKKPVDVSSGPSIQAHFHKKSRTLYIIIHHIAADGGCLSVLLRDLLALGNGTKLPKVSNSYQAVARKWKDKGVNHKEGVEFWLEHLGDNLPILKLPSTPVPNVPQMQGSIYRAKLPSGTLGKVHELAKSLKSSSFVVLLSVYELLLHRYTGQWDLVLGLPTSGRTPATATVVGLFVNTIALRLTCDPSESISKLLSENAKLWRQVESFSNTPFEEVVNGVRAKLGGSADLFDVWFNFLSGIGDSEQTMTSSWIEHVDTVLDVGVTKFQVALDINGDSLVLTVRDSVWDASMSRQFLSHFIHMVNQVVSEEDRDVTTLGRIPVLPEKDKADILSLLTGPVENWRTWPLMHQFFELSADRQPDAVALRMMDEVLSYGELEVRANKLAHVLSTRYKVGLEDCVGILLPRGFEMMECMLAILKVGGVYVPMDPSAGDGTLEDMERISRMKVCLSTMELGLNTRLSCGVALENLTDDIADASSTRPDCPASLDSLAYVLFTSGSTGKPKGVEVCHRGVSNFGNYMDRDYPSLKEDNVLLIPRISWDGSVNTIVFTFARGSTLCIVPPEMAENLTAHIESLVCHMNITRYIAPPGLLEVLDPSERRIGHIISGGDVLTPKLLDKWEASGAVVHNVYGPTETTVYVTHTVGVEDCCKYGDSVSIGIPLPNTKLYVLDEHLQVVPVGVTGEICIGGITLARGYQRREDLTTKVFVPNPFAPGERLYRTGDLGKCMDNGQILFQGRMGGYVKLRGFRVELGAIETVLEQYESVSRCIVLVDETQQVLQAYVALGGEMKNSQQHVEKLHDWCVKQLVDYMVPNRIVPLDELPMDAKNGKVDRRALLAISIEKQQVEQTSTKEPLEGPLEERVGEVFSEVLGIPLNSLGAEDNFFDLGGTSLSVARVVSSIRSKVTNEFVVNDALSIRQFYSNPTVRACCKVLEKDVQEIERERGSTVYSEAERRMSMISEQIILDINESEESNMVKSRRYQTPIVLKCISWLVFLAILSLCLFPSVFMVLQIDYDTSLVMTLLLLMVASFCGILCIFLTTLALKWILLGRVKPGTISRAQWWMFFRWWLVDRFWSILQALLFPFFNGTLWLPVIYRLFGARIGSNVYFEDLSLRNPDMVVIGNGVMVESGVRILTTYHDLESGGVTLGEIWIESHCVVEANAVIESNVRIRHSCVVGALSHLPQGAEIESNSRLRGTLATSSPVTDALEELKWHRKVSVVEQPHETGSISGLYEQHSMSTPESASLVESNGSRKSSINSKKSDIESNSPESPERSAQDTTGNEYHAGITSGVVLSVDDFGSVTPADASLWNHSASTSVILHSLAPFIVQLPVLVNMIGFYVALALLLQTFQVSRLIAIALLILLRPFLDIALLVVTSFLVRIVRMLLLCGLWGRAGECRIFSSQFYRRWIAAKLYENTVSRFRGSVLERLGTWLQGGHVAMRDQFTAQVFEPSLTTMNSGLFAANGVQVRNMRLSRSGHVYFGRVDIGNGCMLLDRSVLYPGSVLEEGVTVGAITTVEAGTLKAGALVFGNPPIQRHRGVPTKPVSLSLATVIGLDVVAVYVLWIASQVPLLLAVGGVVLAVQAATGLGWTAAFGWCMVAIPVAGAALVVVEYGVARLMKRLLCGTFTPNQGLPIDSSACQRWRLYSVVFDCTVRLSLLLFDDPDVTRWWLRSMGAKLSDSSVVDPSALILETDLLTVEEDSRVDAEATLLGHSFQRGMFEMKEVHIGKRCIIGSRAVVFPGSDLGEDVTLLPLTHVLPDEVIIPGVWGGSPAERIGRGSFSL